MSTTERTFADVLNEWTELCLSENSAANLVAVPAIMRLGLRGQQLIAEANRLGIVQMKEAALEEMAKRAQRIEESSNPFV
jgi:hypothetical protein